MTNLEARVSRLERQMSATWALMICAGLGAAAVGVLTVRP